MKSPIFSNIFCFINILLFESTIYDIRSEYNKKEKKWGKNNILLRFPRGKGDQFTLVEKSTITCLPCYTNYKLKIIEYLYKLTLEKGSRHILETKQ